MSFLNKHFKKKVRYAKIKLNTEQDYQDKPS